MFLEDLHCCFHIWSSRYLKSLLVFWWEICSRLFTPLCVRIHNVLYLFLFLQHSRLSTVNLSPSLAPKCGATAKDCSFSLAHDSQTFFVCSFVFVCWFFLRTLCFMNLALSASLWIEHQKSAVEWEGSVFSTWSLGGTCGRGEWLMTHAGVLKAVSRNCVLYYLFIFGHRCGIWKFSG